MKRYCLLYVFALLIAPLAAQSHFVIAIHGLLGDSSTMRSVERNLTCAGIEVYAWDYPSTEGTICSHAQCLMQLIKMRAEAHPDEPIDFVTHSVGALILRQALNIEGCPEEAKIGRAVLLAPPNQGSKLARDSKGLLPVHWALGSKIGCELMTYDPCTIQSIGPFPETMEVLVIAGCKGNRVFFREANDGFLAISETALETPYYFESFKVTHGGLLTNPRVLNSVRAFLVCTREKKTDPEKEKTSSSEPAIDQSN